MSILTNPEFLYGAKGGGAPKPSGAEQNALNKQTEIADWQWQLAQDQNNAQNALLPFYLEEAGISYTPYDRGPEYQGLMEQRRQLESQKKQAKSNHQDVVANQIQAQMDDLDAKMRASPQPDPKDGQVVSYGGQEYLVNKKADPLKAQNEEIARLGGERTLKALKGELDVDPAVTQDLARQEETLHEELIKRLGPGYATSDAGIRALSEFDRNKTQIHYGVRHGELSAAQGIQQVAEDAYRRRSGQQQAGIQGFGGFAGSAANTASGGAAGYGNVAQTLSQNRQNTHQINSQNASAQGNMWGSLAGGVLSAATMGAFAV